MLLGRLRIWGKLALLSAVPLLAILALTVPTVLNRVDQAQSAGDEATKVRVAAQVGSLIQDLQQERLLAVGVLVGEASRSQLTLQIASGTDRMTNIREDLAEDLADNVAMSIDQIDKLSELRTSVLSQTTTPEAVMDGYDPVITGLLASLRMLENIDTGTAEGQQVVALKSLLAADEATVAAATALVILAYDHSEQALSRFIASQSLVRSLLGDVTDMATATQVSLRQLVDKAFTDRFGMQVENDPESAIASRSMEVIYATINSFITLGNFVEKRIVSDVTTAVNERRTTALVTAYTVGVAVLLIIVVVVLLAFTIAGSVVRPLARLTASAERVAAISERELIRVADGESDTTVPIRLESLDVGGKDEIGDLSRAFERVQSTASRLVERQVVSSRNIAEMFGHIGQRTHNLVSRQVSLIDELEREEIDPGRLRRLYRLDHLSNRLLRNASSLVVMSGSDQVDAHVVPVSVADVIRLALGQIEGYERVDMRIFGDAALAPGVVTDLTLVIAELLENATVFSPPTTRVVATAERTSRGVRLTIIDQGIGMSEERLVEENGRLTRRERLDLAPTKVLGLFVVGRLARRHRMTVALMPTLGGGITATVYLGEHLLAAEYRRTTLAMVPPPTMDKTDPDPSIDLAMVERVDTLLASTPSWNAFATPKRSVQAAPAPIGQPARSPQPAQPAQPARSARSAQTRQQASTASTLIGRSGLRRRIPGANHPTGLPVTSAVAKPPDEKDAVAARNLIDQFESGVARAINDFSANR